MRTARSVRTAGAALVLAALAGLTACSDGGDGDDGGTPKAAGATAATQEAPAAAGSGGARYVALGDSYAAGVRIPDIVASAPAGCSRSENNYAHIVARQRGITGFVDVTCGGATTVDMTAPQNVQGGPNPPQLDALKPETELVTLGIGGNDIGFGEIVAVCAMNAGSKTSTTPCTDHFTKGGTDQLSARIADTAPKIAATLDGIRERSPKARILVVGYPAILPESGDGCPNQVPVAAGDLEYLRKLVPALNAMIKTETEKKGAVFVDTYTAGTGHDVCRPAGTKWIEGLKPESEAAPVHPNALGQEGMAKEVLAALG